jgi:divalent metal cation (Fe/Co/Zn/Cd) transporter
MSTRQRRFALLDIVLCVAWLSFKTSVPACACAMCHVNCRQAAVLTGAQRSRRVTGGSERWLWVDPCCTFLFAIGVVYVTKQLVVDIMQDLMERSPDDVPVDTLVAELEALPGVLGVHDMHVWSIGSGKNILTAHVDAADDTEPYRLIGELEEIINARHIAHSTVQICSGRLAEPKRGHPSPKRTQR